jgi:ABC-type Mn2+/Zn2+ transport system permease subunit
VIIIVLLATTGRDNMHLASYVFGSEGIINQTNGWNTGLSFLFGLLSVQWTVSEVLHSFDQDLDGIFR